MKFFAKIAISATLLASVATSAVGVCTFSANAAPASTKLVATPSGYTSAEQVVYSTGTTIANWGARGELCVFLSTYAQQFYTGDNVYETLSTLQGGTSQATGHTNELYSSLQTLMADAHTFYTYYDGNKNVRDYYKYADCSLNDTTQVSLLYRCTSVSSAWDSGKTWNQEHVWPQSKLSTSKQIGDLMHLRPANPSENSSRNNKAYGNTTSSNFYNPGPSVRGDCARMVLYMYVRWGVTNTMWGASGVIENLDTLLEWMEEDPVDTWEMGRNDSVQSVTGTRNVFVDYPEYAWLLFGEEIPDTMDTPSGIAKSLAQKPTTPPDDNPTTPPDDNPVTPPDDNPVTPPSKEETTCQNGEHSFGEWVVTKQATETEFGMEERSCNECGKKEQNVIPKIQPQSGCGSSVALPVCIGLFTATAYVLFSKRKEN